MLLVCCNSGRFTTIDLLHDFGEGRVRCPQRTLRTTLELCALRTARATTSIVQRAFKGNLRDWIQISDSADVVAVQSESFDHAYLRQRGGELGVSEKLDKLPAGE